MNRKIIFVKPSTYFSSIIPSLNCRHSFSNLEYERTFEKLDGKCVVRIKQIFSFAGPVGSGQEHATYSHIYNLFGDNSTYKISKFDNTKNNSIPIIVFLSFSISWRCTNIRLFTVVRRKVKYEVNNVFNMRIKLLFKMHK